MNDITPRAKQLFWSSGALLVGPLILGLLLYSGHFLNHGSLFFLGVLLTTGGLGAAACCLLAARSNPFTAAIVCVVLAAEAGHIFFDYSEFRQEGTHDPGVYQEMARWLSRTGTLAEYPAFTASYPGFQVDAGGNVRNPFLPAYPLFLSAFLTCFGEVGFRVATLTATIFFSAFLLRILSQLQSAKLQGPALAAILLNPFGLYFASSTYTEPFQMALISVGLSAGFDAIRNTGTRWLPLACSALLIAPFTRTEGILAVIPALFLLGLGLIRHAGRGFPRREMPVYLAAACVTGLAALVFVSVLGANPLLQTFFGAAGENLASGGIGNGSAGSIVDRTLMTLAFFWAAMAIASPHLVPFAILGLFAARRTWLRREAAVLLTFAPSLLFLVRPLVALYLPWAFRRYLVTIFPALVLLGLYFAGPAIARRFRRPVLAGLVSSIVVFLLVQPATGIGQVEGAGIQDALARLRANLEPNSMTVFYTKYSIEGFGPTIFFRFNLATLVDRGEPASKATYSYFLEKYSPIYMVTTQPPEKGPGHPYFAKGDFSIVSQSHVRTSRILNFCDVRYLQDGPPSFDAATQLIEECQRSGELRSSPAIIPFFLYRLNETARKAFVDNNVPRDPLLYEPKFHENFK